MRNIHGKWVQTLKKEFVNCNILEVEVGTNGYQGGDSGHGSRTYFKLKDLCSTDIEIIPYRDGFEVMLGGDSELTTFIQALKFATRVLEAQAGE